MNEQKSDVIIANNNEDSELEIDLVDLFYFYRTKWIPIIVTFLAILELMKMGKIFISQERIFDDIKIDSRVAA